MDRRTKYTIKVIKDTFIELLAEKEDIKNISVSEICQRADVNRATFYRYYLDIYDLLDKIEEDFVEEIKNEMHNTEDTEYTVSSFAKDALNVFVKNKELVKVIFSTKSVSNLLNEVLELAYERCKYKWENDIPGISEEEIEYASLFIFNGAIGIINYWVKNDFDKDVAEIADVIQQISYFGIKRFIYRR